MAIDHQAQTPLRDRATMQVAIEETMLDHLSDCVAQLRQGGDISLAEEIETLIRRHRVRLLKHRAIMGARGIEL